MSVFRFLTVLLCLTVWAGPSWAAAPKALSDGGLARIEAPRADAVLDDLSPLSATAIANGSTVEPKERAFDDSDDGAFAGHRETTAWAARPTGGGIFVTASAAVWDDPAPPSTGPPAGL